MHIYLVFHDCFQRSDNQHNTGLAKRIQLVVHERKARKHRFFPKPVNTAAKMSRPRNTLHTTCSCYGFNVAYPRYRAALLAAPSTSPKKNEVPAGYWYIYKSQVNNDYIPHTIMNNVAI